MSYKNKKYTHIQIIIFTTLHSFPFGHRLLDGSCFRNGWILFLELNRAHMDIFSHIFFFFKFFDSNFHTSALSKIWIFNRYCKGSPLQEVARVDGSHNNLCSCIIILYYSIHQFFKIIYQIYSIFPF